MRTTKRDRDDGSSITTGFVLNMGIATVAVSIMLLTLQGPMETIYDNTQETQMRVVGENIASEFERADRMLRDGGDPEVKVEIPDGDYEVRVRNNEIHLIGSRSNVTAEYSGVTPLRDTELANSRNARIIKESTELVIE